MKFKKVQPKENWTHERVEAQISTVGEEITILAKDVNLINSKISGLIEERMIVQRKISNKQKYINQLKYQLNEKDVPETAYLGTGELKNKNSGI